MLAGTLWAVGGEPTIDVNQIMHLQLWLCGGGGKALHMIKKEPHLEEEVLPISHSISSPQGQAIPNGT